MPVHPHHQALRKLARLDPRVAAELERIGLPEPRSRPPGFASLARIIVGQQVSAAAARSMWAKLTSAIDPFTPETVGALTPAKLRKLGMSRQKARYIRELAAAIAAGRLDLDRLHRLEDEVAVAELMKLNGFGRWSAEIYLLFSLGRLDIFPAGDLALAVAMQRLKRLRRRPDPKRLIKLVEPWRPYRGAGAYFLWHYHHAAPFAAAEK